MPIEKIITPMGGLIEVHGYTKEELSDHVRNVIVPYWERYCTEHWLSSNHEDLYCPERRVKAFLDRCGTLMVYGLPGIETKYKEIQHKVREIPISECPRPIQTSVYGGKPAPNDPAIAVEEESRFEMLKEKTAKDKHRDMNPAKPRKRAEKNDTRFIRAQEIRRQYPNATIEICSVDTAGVFWYKGRQYSVAPYVEYAAVNTPAGQYFAMDRVTVVEVDPLLRLYDQSLRFLGEVPLAGLPS